MKENFEGTQVPDLMNELIEKTKAQVEKSKLSNAEFAKSIGMTPQSFSDVLSGHRGSLNQLVRIINGLGYEIQLKLKKKKA